MIHIFYYKKKNFSGFFWVLGFFTGILVPGFGIFLSLRILIKRFRYFSWDGISRQKKPLFTNYETLSNTCFNKESINYRQIFFINSLCAHLSKHNYERTMKIFPQNLENYPNCAIFCASKGTEGLLGFSISPSITKAIGKQLNFGLRKSSMKSFIKLSLIFKLMIIFNESPSKAELIRKSITANGQERA